MPPPEVDGLELHELLSAKAKESWLRDSKGGAFVTRKMFGDAVFQFAYPWVDGATAENYVQFLQGLFSRCLATLSSSLRTRGWTVRPLRTMSSSYRGSSQDVWRRCLPVCVPVGGRCDR